MGDRIRLYEQEALLRAAGDTLRPGNLALTRRLIEACQLPPGARVLDLGCGVGATVAALGGPYRALGLDLSGKLLRQGRQRHPVLPLLQACGEVLPFAARSLDVVLCECSLSVMADVDRVLDEIRRVLKPDGKLALSDLYVRAPAAVDGLRGLPIACLQGALTQDGLSARLRQHSFEPVWWEDHTAALKAFTAQLLFAHQSVAEFWCSAFAPAGADPVQARQAVAQAKLGYCAVIAQLS